MAAMFSGRHDDKLDFDKDGNVFLSYPPQVMLPLVDWLTAHLDLAPEEKHRDVEISFEYKDMWQGALRFFSLEEAVHPGPLNPEPIMFRGIKTNVKISDLEGWEVAFSRPYAHESRMEDFQLPGVPGDSAVLVGAKKAGADELLLAAIGRLDVITAEKRKNHTKLHNGVYWYCTAGSSMGFAPDATVTMTEADTHDRNSPYRMSWHLGQRIGGWRAGEHLNLGDSTEFEKVIMKPCQSLKMSE